MELIKFLGWGGPKSHYGLFEIKRGMLPNGNSFEKILVAHEGECIDVDSMSFHEEFKLYEDVQKELGKGLSFLEKEYSEHRNRSFFLYDFEYTDDGEYILAVPATGEEIYSEIYGVDQFGSLNLLVKRGL